jgi:hypothetical protein
LLYSLEKLKSLHIESDSDKVILAEPKGKIITTLNNLTLAVHHDFKTENLNVINSYSNIKTLNLKVNSINGIGRIIGQKNIKNLQLEVYRKQSYSQEDVSFLQSMEQLSINFDICRHHENVVFSNLRSLNINGTCLFELPSSYNFPLLTELQINKPISPKEFNNLPSSLTSLTSHSIRKNKEKLRLKIKKFEYIEVYSDSKILQELVQYGAIKTVVIKNNLLLDEITFTKRLKRLVSNQKRTEDIKESCLYIKPRKDTGDISYFLPTRDCIYTGYQKL